MGIELNSTNDQIRVEQHGRKAEVTTLSKEEILASPRAMQLSESARKALGALVDHYNGDSSGPEVDGQSRSFLDVDEDHIHDVTSIFMDYLFPLEDEFSYSFPSLDVSEEETSIETWTSKENSESSSSSDSFKKAHEKEKAALSKSKGDIGKATEKHFKEILRQLPGARIHVEESFEKESIDRMTEYLIEHAESLLDANLDPRLQEILQSSDLEIDLTFDPSNPNQEVHYTDDLGMIIEIVPRKDHRGWEATLTTPDGAKHHFTTSKRGERGFDAIVEKVKEKRLQQICVLCEINVKETLPGNRTPKWLARLELFFRKQGEFYDRGVPAVVAGLGEQAAIEGHVSGVGLSTLSAILQLRAISRDWKKYKEKNAHIMVLRKEGNQKEAALLEKQAMKLRREIIGQCLFSTNTLVGNACKLGNLIVGMNHATSILSVAVMATGIGAGAFIALEGVRELSSDVRKIVKNVDKKKQLSEMKRASKDIQKTEPKGSSNAEMLEKAALLEDFANEQKVHLNFKLAKHSVALGGDASLITGGSLVIASAVLGGTTLGIGAAATLGGAAAVGGGILAISYIQKRRERKRQEKLEIEKPHLSMRGLLTRLYFAVKKEEHTQDKTISDKVIHEYLHMSPELFMVLIEPIATKFESKLS